MNLISTSRVVLSFILAVIWLSLIPIYGSPFSGCEVRGYSIFNLGCSSWPETIRGFGFVLLLSTIPPHAYKMHYISLGIMFLVTTLGGFELIRVHELPSSFQDVVNFFIGASPLFYGAVFAVIVYFSLYHLWGKMLKINTKA